MSKPGEQWWLYILRCADGSLYTGITNDLAARLDAHNRGTGAKYTRGRGPVELTYIEPCIDRSMASKREYEIKRLSLEQKRRLIERSSLPDELSFGGLEMAKG